MPDTEQTTTQAANGQSPWEAQAASGDEGSQRPELLVGAALLGGIVLAQVLKRLGGDD
jgi:MYXO-CTERM domain-containing protein